MPKAKITKTFVDKTPFTEKGQVLYCDTELAGFYLITGMKSKTYVAQKDIQGKTIRFTIGRHGHFTPDEARKIAKDKLYLMAQGINPNIKEKEDNRKIITLSQVLESYCNTRKSINEKTKSSYKYYINKYLSNWLDNLMADIDKAMVIDRHSYIGEEHGKRVANHTIQILRALFNHANATFDICEINPVSYMSKTKAWYPEKRRRTYIKPYQLKTWWDAVQTLENDTMRDFFTLLLFTGLRRNEGASLKWSDIDFQDKTFTISETKNGDDLTLPISDSLLEMFEARRKRYGNYDFVFPGTGKLGYLAEPKKGVAKVIKISGVSFTCHDLRRTFITMAEGLEISSYALKRLINHRSTDVTGGYIIVDVERLRAPVKKIEQFILEKVNGKENISDFNNTQ